MWYFISKIIPHRNETNLCCLKHTVSFRGHRTSISHLLVIWLLLLQSLSDPFPVVLFLSVLHFGFIFQSPFFSPTWAKPRITDNSFLPEFIEKTRSPISLHSSYFNVSAYQLRNYLQKQVLYTLTCVSYQRRHGVTGFACMFVCAFCLCAWMPGITREGALRSRDEYNTERW